MITGGAASALAAAAAIGALAAPPAGADDPPCTPAQTGGEPPPLTFSDEAGNGGWAAGEKGTIIVGHRYYLSINDDARAPSGYQGREGSVRVSGPPDLELTPVREGTRTLGYRFRVQRARAVHFDVTWTLESPDYPYPGCTATGSLDYPAVEAHRARFVRARFHKAKFRVDRRPPFYASDVVDTFRLDLARGGAPAETAPVRVLVRVRAGSARAPKARGPAAATITIRPEDDDAGREVTLPRARSVVEVSGSLAPRGGRGVAVTLSPCSARASRRSALAISSSVDWSFPA